MFLSQDLLNDKGYQVLDLLDSQASSEVVSRINNQFLQILGSIYSSIPADLSLHTYHLYSHLYDHSSIWSKMNRLLSSDDSIWFQTLPEIIELFDSFDVHSISDEESLGFPNIYWRLVRPSESSDIGPVHRDEWFWLLNSDYQNFIPESTFRLKIWIALLTDPGKNGLIVYPNSHHFDDILWSGKQSETNVKPQLLSSVDHLESTLLPLRPGQAVVFNDRLLHAGSINLSSKVRVSLEMTMFCRIGND